MKCAKKYRGDNFVKRIERQKHKTLCQNPLSLTPMVGDVLFPNFQTTADDCSKPTTYVSGVLTNCNFSIIIIECCYT